MSNLKPLRKWHKKPGTDEPSARAAWEAFERESKVNQLVEHDKGFFAANVVTRGFSLNVLLDPLGNFSPAFETEDNPPPRGEE